MWGWTAEVRREKNTKNNVFSIESKKYFLEHEAALHITFPFS